MKKTNIRSILHMVVVLSVLAGLLLCLNGCKKKPAGDNTTASTSGDTTPSTTPNQTTAPSVTTTPTTTPTTPTTTPTVETTVNNCPHILSGWKVGTPSTCTTEGSRYKECTLCKEKVETEVIPTTAHSPTWVVDKKATCTAEGSQHQECSQCKKLILTIVVARADHKTTPTKGLAATATSNGLTAGAWCSTCGKTVQEQFTIPALNDLGVTYTVNADGKSCTVTGVTNKSTSALILPDAIDGYKITAIANGAFTDHTALKTVYLPDSVTSIGAQAFKGCSLLNNITYEGKTTQWLSIGKGTDWRPNNASLKIYCSNNYLTN